jgi:uncharacterized protein YjdB
VELSKRNLLIVGGIILVLLLGIVVLSKKPTPKPVTNGNPSGQDFNVVDKKEEEVVVFNTPTPIPTLIPTLTPIPTVTLTPTPTLIPTLTPTPTIKIIPTRRPTRQPTATPTPDTSIKATGVSLSTTELNLEINQTYQIQSRVEPNDTTDKSVSWSSSDSNIATVDANGNVIGRNLGETFVTARTSNSKTTFVKVTVKNKEEIVPTLTSVPTPKVKTYAQRIVLNYSSLTLKVNYQKQLRANFTPEIVSDFSIKWSSSDANIATVDILGMVRAKSTGNTIVTAKTINGVTATCQITVIGEKTNITTTTIKKESNVLGETNTVDQNICRLDKRLFSSLDQLILSYNSQNPNNKLIFISCYRSTQEQEKLWQQYLSENNGDELKTISQINYPGTSPHQTGLAIDFGDNFGKLTSNSSSYKWLVLNAPEFGFRHHPLEPEHWEYKP